MMFDRNRDAMAQDRFVPSLLSVGMSENAQFFDGKDANAEAFAPTAARADYLEIDLRRILTWLRGGVAIAAVTGSAGAILAASYGLLANPRYTVSSEILIEAPNIPVINNDLYAQPVPQGDRQALVLSNRARLMTSGNVLARVVKTLRLNDDPEFFQPASSMFGSSPPVTQADAEVAALKKLQKKIALKSDGRSFIAELSVNAWTPEKAIAISNALITAFNADLAVTEAESANRAAKALDERLAVLKANALAADDAVETYKRTHGLSTGENGQLISSQAMTQTNNQILAARTRAIEAHANYNSLARATDTAAAIPELPGTLRDLKLRVSTLEQQLRAQQTTYGRRHPSIVRLQSELVSAREQIRAELRRATDGAKAEKDRADEALDELILTMAKLQSAAFSDGHSQVALRELQRDSLAKTQIYDSFLMRVSQIAERERITTDTVRVVTPPSLPNGRSWPPSPAILFVIGGIVGAALGLGLALMWGAFLDFRRFPIAGKPGRPHV